MCVIQCVSTRVYNHVEMGIHICVTEYMSLFVCVFIYINERKYQWVNMSMYECVLCVSMNLWVYLHKQIYVCKSVGLNMWTCGYKCVHEC